MAKKRGPIPQDRQIEEFRRCSDGVKGFFYWCETYARIEDKDTHRPVPFKLYACQRRIIRKVFQGKWLRVLKARRLGVTWLFAAYAVWMMTFQRMRTVGYLIHKRDYSEDFIDRCDFIASRIPAFLRPKPTTSNRKELDYKDNESWIRALSATKGAADSVAADLVIVDEATKIEEKQAGLLGSILQSIEPTVETAKGTIILIAKSEGPQGLFYKGWQASKKGRDKYENVFLSWKMRPGRTPAWYKHEAAMHAADPLFMPRNYPANEDEAFQQAEGRVYQAFNLATHVGRILPTGEMTAETEDELWVPDFWPKWRAIDFGGRDPFVCLFIARVEKEGVRLTVDPACEKTIGEFLSYRYKPHTDYFEDKNNHCLPYEAPVLTDIGYRPIGEIRAGDQVWTRGGLRTVLQAGVTGIDRPLFEVVTASGRRLVATENHPVLLADGTFRCVGNLAPGDEVIACHSNFVSNRMESPRLSTTMARFSGDIRSRPISTCDDTFGTVDSASCTVLSTKTTLVPSPTVCTFIMRTRTPATTARRTWSWLVPRSMLLSTGRPSEPSGSVSMPNGFGPWPESGMARKKGGRGIGSMRKKSGSAKERPRNMSASSAEIPSRAPSQVPYGFAVTNARPPHDAPAASMTLNVSASSVESRSGSIATPRPSLVRDRVRTVRSIGRKATVYDLTVDGEHEFVASGIVVSNSMDALRYCCETFNLQKGHYHIYRELYLPNSAGEGLEVPDLAAMIVDMSGDEQFNMTVADRSQPNSINSLQLHKVPCMPNQHYLIENSTRRSRIAQGVRMVNALLIGTKEFLPARVRPEPTPEERVKHPGKGVSVNLEEARLLRRKEEKKQGKRGLVRARRRQMRVTSRMSRRPSW